MVLHSIQSKYCIDTIRDRLALERMWKFCYRCTGRLFRVSHSHTLHPLGSARVQIFVPIRCLCETREWSVCSLDWMEKTQFSQYSFYIIFPVSWYSIEACTSPLCWYCIYCTDDDIRTNRKPIWDCSNFIFIWYALCASYLDKTEETWSMA
jgi:hypothetical protein